jgi:hypothetical protein
VDSDTRLTLRTRLINWAGRIAAIQATPIASPEVRAVVDTNVIAYYVLGTPEVDAEVREFWRRVEDPMAPTYTAWTAAG